MSIQHQRLVELCHELRLGGIAAQYTALAHVHHSWSRLNAPAENGSSSVNRVNQAVKVRCEALT